MSPNVVKKGPQSESFLNIGKSKFSQGNSSVLSINYEDLEIDHNAESVYYAKTGISSVIRETIKTD